jgi:hypothetical protein
MLIKCIIIDRFFLLILIIKIHLSNNLQFINFTYYLIIIIIIIIITINLSFEQ